MRYEIREKKNRRSQALRKQIAHSFFFFSSPVNYVRTASLIMRVVQPSIDKGRVCVKRLGAKTAKCLLVSTQVTAGLARPYLNICPLPYVASVEALQGKTLSTKMDDFIICHSLRVGDDSDKSCFVGTTTTTTQILAPDGRRAQHDAHSHCLRAHAIILLVHAPKRRNIYRSHSWSVFSFL